MSENLKFHQNLLLGLGQNVIGMLKTVGGIINLFYHTILYLPKPPFRIRETIKQMKIIGYESAPLILVVTAFVGSIIMIELRYQLDRLVHTSEWSPGFAAIFMFRETGTAVVSAMIACRAGAGIAAEIGTMQITEQVDALKLLRTNPVHYLVVPRFVACIIMTEALALFGVAAGMTAAFLFCMDIHNIMSFIGMLRRFTGIFDLFNLVEKSFFFGMATPIISCYFGFDAKGGAEGVGIATTKAVVYSLLTVIALDFFLTGSAKAINFY